MFFPKEILYMLKDYLKVQDLPPPGAQCKSFLHKLPLQAQIEEDS